MTGSIAFHFIIQVRVVLGVGIEVGVEVGVEIEVQVQVQIGPSICSSGWACPKPAARPTS